MKDWIIRYVEAKDAFSKRLKKYDIKDDIIEFDFGDYKHYYLFRKNLSEEVLNKAKKFRKKTLVCEKNDYNLDFLIKNFEELSVIDNFVLIFLDKNKTKKLLLNPKAHKMIADPDTLKEGLNALWDNS